MSRGNLLPRPLKRGDTLGVVAPAGPSEAAALESGLAFLQEIGDFRVVRASNVGERWGYLAGDDRARAEGLMEMFARPDVAGILCARGGYGSARLLPYLDFNLIRSHPKLFLGSSDVTLLTLALRTHAGLLTFHGPMVEPDFGRLRSPLTVSSVQALLLSEERCFEVTLPLTPLGGGPIPSLSGPLIGGNLSLVVSTLGTPYEIETAGHILFLEEVNEEPYRLDRMLTQLRLAGKLEQVRAVLLGDFYLCEPSNPSRPSFSADEVLRQFAEMLDIPCLGGLPIGHRQDNVVLPQGGTITIEAAGGAEAHLTIGW